MPSSRTLDLKGVCTNHGYKFSVIFNIVYNIRYNLTIYSVEHNPSNNSYSIALYFHGVAKCERK